MTIKEAMQRIKIHMRVHRLDEERADKITQALYMAVEALKEKQEREDPKPLAADEVLQMVGEPICVTGRWGERLCWMIIEKIGPDGTVHFQCKRSYKISRYGIDWFAYRYKPKAGEA